MCRPILSNESVRLVRDLPELDLPAGSLGVVLSAWFYPTTAYEVQFGSSGDRDGAGGRIGLRRGRSNKLLLLEGEVAPADPSLPELAAGLLPVAAG